MAKAFLALFCAVMGMRQCAAEEWFAHLDFGVVQGVFDRAHKNYMRDAHDQKGFGLNFSAIELPFAGMLLKDGENNCSGTLVARDTFVTAAHCVCQTILGRAVLYDPDYGSCSAKELAGSHKFEIFFPANGKTYGVTGTPILHKDYHKISTENWFETTTVADLAVFKTAQPVDLPPAPIAAADSKALRLVYGVGLSSIVRGDPANSKGAVEDGLYSNLPVLAFVTPDTAPELCPKALKDAICEKTFGDDSSGKAHELPCAGDSGGGLVVVSPNGDLGLWGVTSVVKENTDCSSTSGSAVFTNLTKYGDWILSFSNDVVKNEINANLDRMKEKSQCAEAFVQIPSNGTTTIELLEGGQDLNAAIMSSVDLDLSDPEAATSGKCSWVGDRSNRIRICAISKNVALNFTGKGPGGALFVLCRAARPAKEP